MLSACRSPRRYLDVSEADAVRHDLAIGAFEDDLPAQFARAGPHVDDVIGGAHHVGIVLHNHDGVAEVAQLFQDADQPAGVARVQSDGRLVQNVAGAHQPRSQASGELDALRFPARERGRQPVQRQIVEPDVVQEFQALADFDQDLVGDGRFFRRQFERFKELVGLLDVQLHDIGDGFAGDPHVERLGAQARTIAVRAVGVASIAAQKDAHVDFVLLGLHFGERIMNRLHDDGLLFRLQDRRTAHSSGPCRATIS